MEIRVLAKRGAGVREIAREVGVSRNTVRRYLRDPGAVRYRGRPPRAGKLAGFEDYIASRVAEAAPERLEATVLLRELRERDCYGRGQHRFHPGFLDFAGHCGFRPRLCQPYRAQSKGKVERFIRYLRGGFWVPLASRMAADGVVVDRAAANLAVGRWLGEVANARVHATTGEVPLVRLETERGALRRVPPPYGGLVPRQAVPAPPAAPRPIVGLQHPLGIYDSLFTAPVTAGIPA